MTRRLQLVDRLRIGALGLISRPARTALSSLGIAIGITGLVGILGLSESSRADLNQQLDALGTNLLTVEPGQTFAGTDATLPEESVAMVDRMSTIDAAAAIRAVDATVRKNYLVPEENTSGLGVVATDSTLLDTVAAEVRDGRWLDQSTETVQAVVLGATAARRLAIDDTTIARGARIWIDGRWFAVIGVLDPVVLAPELDEMALVGTDVAHAVWGENLPPTKIYIRAIAAEVSTTRSLLARTVNPADPSQITLSRPSDALEAKAAVDESLTTLTLGLGAVALLVGAVGIANTMVISVLERRREIGVRRALGATRWAIGTQFLAESVLLSLIGGLTGAFLGVLGTVLYARSQDWGVVVPWAPIGLGLLAACLVGTIVGLYPAARAAAVPPTEALRSV
ncbi:MAG: ABC transporter permease [Actinomycetota bacterium]|nr:ABC transporter permease [Actinomycetota bacterium]